jgi:hypothetical protein
LHEEHLCACVQQATEVVGIEARGGPVGPLQVKSLDLPGAAHHVQLARQALAQEIEVEVVE